MGRGASGVPAARPGRLRSALSRWTVPASIPRSSSRCSSRCSLPVTTPAPLRCRSHRAAASSSLRLSSSKYQSSRCCAWRVASNLRDAASHLVMGTHGWLQAWGCSVGHVGMQCRLSCIRVQPLILYVHGLQCSLQHMGSQCSLQLMGLQAGHPRWEAHRAQAAARPLRPRLPCSQRHRVRRMRRARASAHQPSKLAPSHRRNQRARAERATERSSARSNLQPYVHPACNRVCTQPATVCAPSLQPWASIMQSCAFSL